MRDTFIKKLELEAASNNKVFLIVGDIGYGVVENYSETFPNQFMNAGVAEQNMTGMAAGIASRGRKVFTYSIANFPVFRALEQIRLDVCYSNLPVTIVSIGAGVSYGTLGYSHHALEDIAVMRALPNMRVFSPCDPTEVELSVDEILSTNEPAYLRLGKNGESDLHQKFKLTSVSTPNSLLQGRNILIFSTGAITSNALDAASRLNKAKGAVCHLVSVPRIKPLDLTALDLEDYGAIVTIEEHSLVGGLGSAILEYISDSKIRAGNVYRIAIKDEISHALGTPEYLRDIHNLSVEGIYSKLLNVFEELRIS